MATFTKSIYPVTVNHLEVSDITSGECRALFIVDNSGKIEVGDFLEITDSRKSTVVRVVSHIQRVSYKNGTCVISFRKMTAGEMVEYNEK